MEEKNIIEENEMSTNEQKPSSNNSVLAWFSFLLSFMVPIIGLGVGIYSFLSLTEEDKLETKIVSLMAIGIGAFIAITSFISANL